MRQPIDWDQVAELAEKDKKQKGSSLPLTLSVECVTQAGQWIKS